MEQLNDHPAIRAAERYGYPKPQKAVHTCSWCDEPIYEGEDCWDLSPYGWCCQNCMITRQCCAEEYNHGGF